MLQVANLQVHYGMIEALKSASLHVGEGEIVALIGANGAGKTTLLSALSGLVRPTRGQVLVNGHDVTRRRPDQIVRAGVSLVPEGRRIFKPLTVEDNLLLGSYHRFSLRRAHAIRAEIEETFQLFPELSSRRRQLAGTLSGGEQQMLAIGRALLSHPKVLLLDEPSMGLAPRIIREIFGYVSRLRRERGMTILLVEQNAKAALGVADRAYVLETGRVVLEGPSADLLANRAVQQAYLGRTQEGETQLEQGGTGSTPARRAGPTERGRPGSAP